jgi:hypothetical protein
MPPPKSLDSFPPVFAQAVQRAFSRGEFTIPARTSAAATLRMQMFGYLRTLRANGQAELADSIYITELPNKTGIKLIHRESAPVALDIAAALGDDSPPEENPGDSFFDKLGV